MDHRYEAGANGEQLDTYRIFIALDGQAEWVGGGAGPLPDPGICFRKQHLPNATATAEELDRAHECVGA